jgi:hypothetical protein
VEGSINPIVDCWSDALSGSRVLFRCLNRDMAEQKLDLIQFTACVPAEPSTGSAQIVRCKGRDTDFRSGRPYHMPYCLFADAIPEHATCSADTAKHLPTIDGWWTEPAVQLRIHPVGHRDRANMPAFANKIDDGPMVFSLLQIFDSEIGGLVSPQSARQEKSQQGTVTFPFIRALSGLCHNERACSSLSQFPIRMPFFFRPFTRRIPAARSELSSPQSAAS